MARIKSDIKIFNKDGKELDIVFVICRFIKERAEKHNLDYSQISLILENNLFEVVELNTDDFSLQDTLENCKLNNV